MNSLSIKELLQRAVVLLTVGSAANCAHPRPAPLDDILPDLLPGCGDPVNCNDPNGTGIYTAEGGSAGIGPSRMMILYFVNKADSVRFQGVYLAGTPTPKLGGWRTLPEPGSVDLADYEDRIRLANGIIIPVFRTGLEVRSITEKDAIPVWQLWDGKHFIWADDPRRLSLHISFGLAGPKGPQQSYLIDFQGEPVAHDDADLNERHPSATYNMRWTPLEVDPVPNPVPATPYCHRSPDQPDSVVFQQHIMVDPWTGQADHPQDDVRIAQFVTLSCYLGAPATVFRWGYNYDSATPADNAFFDGAIQMKRASYCADQHAYTSTGTRISITDTSGPPPVHHEALVEATEIEASWTKKGATCLNREAARYPERIPPDLSCNNKKLLPCTSGDILGEHKIYDSRPDKR